MYRIYYHISHSPSSRPLFPLPSRRFPTENPDDVAGVRILLALEDFETVEPALAECILGEHRGDGFADYLGEGEGGLVRVRGVGHDGEREEDAGNSG